ncbi:hypothetical protein SLNSH_17360 [Alsobacter soli]|uniref:Capsular biosynthesis protein n=1 Tax=Alsobacter soli TaxID=2109933 RepID=A0A2T1HQ05_9HYPH|nr:hypothetical protein [Alsobacter soli]PSC03713.1 hypothetical protein SLNSH_17360 [Alsobacter soli]
MKIGYWFDYDQTWTFTALHKVLAERIPGLQTCGFVMNDRYWAHAVESLPPGTRLVRFYEEYRRGMAFRPTADQVASFRKFDERVKLARIAYSDRHILMFDHATLIAVNIHLKKVFEEFLDAEQPDAFVFNCIASQFAHLFYELMRERGIQVIVPTAWGLEDLFYIADNPYFACEDAWAAYRGFKEGLDGPTAEESAFARGFIERIRSHKPAYDNAAVATEERKFQIPGPAAVGRYLINHYRYYRTDPTQPGIIDRALKPLTLKRQLARAQRYFADRSALEDTPFVYMPLHYEPEIATLVLSQCRQTSLIDIIARRLPLTWRLVLKEHPALAGQREISFYEEIAHRYPNVMFVDARIPSLDLTIQSRLVFTLNGTAAIEAASLGKPALLQAQARFGGFGVIPRLVDPFAFETVMQDAIDNPPGLADVELMLAACRRFGRPMKFAEPLANSGVLEPANMAKLADAIQGSLRSQ